MLATRCGKPSTKVGENNEKGKENERKVVERMVYRQRHGHDMPSMHCRCANREHGHDMGQHGVLEARHRATSPSDGREVVQSRTTREILASLEHIRAIDTARYGGKEEDDGRHGTNGDHVAQDGHEEPQGQGKAWWWPRMVARATCAVRAVWSNVRADVEGVFCKAMACGGPVPRHVAFIMDGNRRFAEAKHLRTSAGHGEGFQALARTLRWCGEVGVECVTVFAFSHENFGRRKEQVDELLTLATDKFYTFSNHQYVTWHVWNPCSIKPP